MPSTHEMNLFLFPTMAYDAGTSPYRPSAIALVSGGGTPNNFPLHESTQAGTDWKPTNTTGSLLIPNRPYYTATNELDNWRLVSYAVRVRYTGTALNANGTLKCLASPHGELNATSATPRPLIRDLINTLQSSPHTTYKSIYDKAVYEFNFVGEDKWLEADNFCGAVQGRDTYQYVGNRLGQATSEYTAGESGAYLFYTNNANAAVQFEIELVENWEVRANNLQPFYTQSHSDPVLHHEMMTTINTAHTLAGMSSEKSFANVVGTVAKASKSPLGKVLLAAALS